MIVEIIAKYLESNKRLVIPNLGAFIVKVPAQTVLFSNLIKNDDGVLRALLRDGGMSELDAAALIDRFVFEVNYRLEHSQVCALSGFGVLRSGKNGTVSFAYDRMAKGDVLDGDADERMAAHVAEITSIIEPVVEPDQEPAAETAIVAEQPQDDDAEDDGEDTIDILPRAEEPAKVVNEAAKVDVVERPSKERQEDRQAEARRRREQNDYVKGLRYGKGRKVVTGREGATSRKSSKGSFIIVIAIIAALIAMGALAYGLWNDWNNRQYMYEGLDEEVEIFDQTPASAEEGVRNPDLDYITPNEN